MKNLTSLVFLFLHLSQTHSQNIEFKWGKDFKKLYVRGYSPVCLVSATDSICTFAQIKDWLPPANFHFYKKTFDGELTRIPRLIKLPKIEHRKTELVDIKSIDNVPIVISYIHKRRTYTSYGQLFKNDSVLNDHTVILAKKKNTMLRTAAITYTKSPDTKKFMTYYLEARDKKQKVTLTCKVIDRTTETVWENNFNLPYIKRQCEISEIQIDNAGDLYFLAKLKYVTEGVKLDKPVYRIFYYNSREKILKEQEININNNYIFDLKYQTDKNGNLVCGGLFCVKKEKNKEGNKPNEHWVKGAFYCIIDKKQNKILSQATQTVTSKFDRGELPAYYLDHMRLMEDETVIFVSERRYFEKTREQYSTAYFRNDEILLIGIHPDSSRSWSKIIKKYQSYSFPVLIRYNSYALLSNKKELYLLYCGDDQRVDRVTTKGEISSESLFKGTSECILPKMSMQQSDDEIIFFSEISPERYRFGKAKLRLD